MARWQRCAAVGGGGRLESGVGVRGGGQAGLAAAVGANRRRQVDLAAR